MQPGSLYERLGGEAAIQAAVDIFYDKVMGDPSVSSFFSGLDMDVQVRKMVGFMSWAFGGPLEYRGRDLGEAHRALVQRGLNDAHFDTIAMHLRATLQELGVQPALIDEVLKLVGGTRDVVLSRVP